MRKIYILVVLCLLSLSFSNCNKAKSNSRVLITDDKIQDKKDLKLQDFEQGVIYYELSVSDSLVQGFIQSMISNATFVKDNAYGQSKDSVYIREFIAANPGFWQEVGYFPFGKNTVYMAGYEAVYKGESFTFKVENKYNDILEKGFVFIKGRLGIENDLNLYYSLDTAVICALQNTINLDNYLCQSSKDTVSILGYPVDKKTYTLKESLKETSQCFTPYSFTLYTSEAFNSSINRVLPFFVDIPQGILKMDFTLNPRDSFYLSWAPSSIVDRKVSLDESMISASVELFDASESSQYIRAKEKIRQIMELPKIQ